MERTNAKIKYCCKFKEIHSFDLTARMGNANKLWYSPLIMLNTKVK